MLVFKVVQTCELRRIVFVTGPHSAQSNLQEEKKQHAVDRNGPALNSTTVLVSLSSRYMKMTTWQQALTMIMLAERPSIDLLDFQKPMSFLKASISKTVCSSDTKNVSAKK
jgi:hypothetical protein